MNEKEVESKTEGERQVMELSGEDIASGLLVLASNCYYSDLIAPSNGKIPPGFIMTSDPVKGSAAYLADCLIGKRVPISVYLIQLLRDNQFALDFHWANKR